MPAFFSRKTTIYSRKSPEQIWKQIQATSIPYKTLIYSKGIHYLPKKGNCLRLRYSDGQFKRYLFFRVMVIKFETEKNYIKVSYWFRLVLWYLGPLLFAGIVFPLIDGLHGLFFIVQFYLYYHLVDIFFKKTSENVRKDTEKEKDVIRYLEGIVEPVRPPWVKDEPSSIQKWLAKDTFLGKIVKKNWQ